MARSERFRIAPGGITGFTHAAPPEDVRLNKYHLLWTIERLLKRRFRPHGDWAAIPAATALASFTALLTADFRDTLGFDKATWHAVFVLLTISMTIATIVFLVWWLTDKFVHHDQTPLEIVEEIMDQIVVRHDL